MNDGRAPASPSTAGTQRRRHTTDFLSSTLPGFRGRVCGTRLLDLFQMFEVVVVLTACDLEQLVLRPCQRIRNAPRLRVDSGIGNDRAVVDRIAIDRREALDNLLLIADDFSRLIEPALAVETGRLDHERIALPMPHRITLPQMDGLRWMGSAIEGDDSVRRSGIALEEKHHIAGRLKDLEPAGVHRARNAVGETMCRRIVVAPIRTHAALLLRLRPLLHRQLSVGRIDDEALSRRDAEFRGVDFQTEVRPRRLRVEVALEVWF